jgi:hypothetical protein
MAVTVLFGLYCLEAGLFFMIVPWTRFWAVNPILHHPAAMGALADSPYFRGFISGVGLIHLLLGLRELTRVLSSKKKVEE